MVKEKIEKKVELPEGFSPAIEEHTVTIRSGKGEASREFKAKGVSFRQQDSTIVLEGKPASRKMNALLATIASHIRNMAAGLQNPYQCKLAVVYSHFPMSISVKGSVVEINNFVGEKHPRVSKIRPNTTVEVKGKEVIVKGSSKEGVGQTAANLERATKVRGKDRRIYQDGIFIVEKTKQVEIQEKGGR
ncbi:MAG: 50S ribosomal protein L6 [Candidatus Diapherotrites archaeon]|uniref:50S ribosomal protein L6 n=1 Tax=Candidatus Iainarchaeum sp. TaxID=3101447 RepID=A0A939C9N3_9ARCH|nr:50S ribosomal protein L6 [Candidatus Diapherotrites archaeon]